MTKENDTDSKSDGKAAGSMEALSSLQITADTAGLDQASKELYKNKEVLAVILKGVVREFEPYSYDEIMNFIEADSITDNDEVSPGRVNTRVVSETHSKNEKTFLHAVMYPHREDFLDTVKEYIDFSQNEKLWQEVDRMSGLGMSIALESFAHGEVRGEEQGMTLSAEVFKAVQAGEQDNEQIAVQCGCTAEKVAKIRKAFGI